MNEIQETAERLRAAGEKIATKAAELKETADQLRADVDELAARVTVIEENGHRSSPETV